MNKQIIQAFFSKPPATSARSLIPASYYKEVAPLESEELEKLGKLAALDVSNKDQAFSKSVAQVLNFCAAVGDNKANMGKPARYHQAPQLLVDDGGSERVSEGNIAKELLRNASRTQEGYFAAPMANKME